MFWPLDPRPEDIKLPDIAHALACVNRYNGHAPEPYSVAQHSVLVSRRAYSLSAGMLEAERINVARWGLLHDAAEAYIGDMPKPLKSQPEMVEFRRCEEKIMRAVAERFGLVGEEPPDVKQADLDLLVSEAAQFFPEVTRPAPWHVLGAVLDPVRFDVRPLPWKQARAEFARAFAQLWPELHR
jgi:5'-deoxynucleotidase YfbR-like HD superfamily hydrolase